MKADLRAYASLTVANLKMYLRNPIASSSLFLVLILLLIAVKIVFTGNGPHTKVVVVNRSSSVEAATLVKDLRAVDTFDVTIARTESDARKAMNAGQEELEIVIPSDFPSRDSGGKLVPEHLPVTYRAGTAGESSLPGLKGVVESFDESVLGAVPPVSLTAAALHTRATGVIDVFLPGVVAFNIIGGALMLAAGVFSTYKSTGVLRRLKATGIKPSVFVLSHATSTFAFGAAQTAAILLAAALLFSVHLDLLSLFLVLCLGYLVFLAMGLAISGWIRDPQRATGLAQSVAFPMIFVALLSSAIPPDIAAVTKYLPVSYVTDAMQRLGEGGGVAAIGTDLGWLAGWAVLLLIGGSRAFRWD